MPPEIIELKKRKPYCPIIEGLYWKQSTHTFEARTLV